MTTVKIVQIQISTALHKLFVGGERKKSWQKWTIVAINVISFTLQLAGLFIWVSQGFLTLVPLTFEDIVR